MRTCCVGLVIVFAAAGCAPAAPGGPAPLALALGAASLAADGVDHTTVTATAPGAAGLVVSFSATGGFLSSSAAIPGPDGRATVELVADREEALLGRAQKPVTVRATITRAVDDVESATADLVFTAPTSGAPSLAIAATPTAATA